MARQKKNGVAYLRRSTDKQEISLRFQLEWAIKSAQQHGVALDATVDDLEHMQAHRLHKYKAIYLDDGITGSDLTRPGFLAVIKDAAADRAVSHLFIYKRDRFARPDDAIRVVQIEEDLLRAGLTIVFSDAVSAPIRRGEQHVIRSLELLLSYSQGGEEIRKHAERVLGFQKMLAEGGYRVGGNAPYGFVRVLVDAKGNTLEELPPGKTVRQPGCHVRVVPKDSDKIAVWLQMLEWRGQGWGFKRIAMELNKLRIPSPDAGRTRTDHGVRHRVSGKWSPNTVAELCRNPIIVGIQEYGKRSEGKIRRLGIEGPRLLEEGTDIAEQGGLRVVFNSPALRINKEVGEAKSNQEQWASIQRQTADRGKNQRGIPRAKDPARYPLACRLVDLTGGCGSILYGRTSQGRPVYTCGRYMRTSGAECASNQVDAEAMLRFTLLTLKQLVDRNGNREKLRLKLLERAQKAAQNPDSNPHAVELTRLRAREAALSAEKDAIEFRMARERDDRLYSALTHQYKAVLADLATIEESRRQLEAVETRALAQAPIAQAEAVLSILDDVLRITSEPQARADVNPLLQRLGLRIGLRFGSTVKGKKRVVQRIRSGQMVFGNARLPVPLFGKDNAEHQPHTHSATDAFSVEEGNPERDAGGEHATTTTTSAVAEGNGQGKMHITEAGAFPAVAPVLGDLAPNRLIEGQPGGISITKDSRGKRI